MKILYIYRASPNAYQQYLIQLLKSIKKNIDVKSFAYLYDQLFDYHVKTYGFKDCIQRFFFKTKVSKYTSADIKFFSKFDLIHLQHSYLFPKILPLLKLSHRPKIVITLRGGDTYLKPWINNKWLEFYQNEANLIDAFITVSKHQKDYLLKWGVNAQKIHVIPVSFGEYSLAQPKYPNKNILYLVSAFRMTWEKNILGSLLLAKNLMEKGINFHYDIFGDQRDLSQVYFLVDKFKLCEHVFVKNKIDNNTLKAKLKEYDFFVQLSVSEALSVSVLEAQSEGVPCIVSDTGGLPEAVLKGQTAVVREIEDIELMVSDALEIWMNKELYYSYSNAAINFVNSNFTIQKEEARLKKLYNDLNF